MCKLRNEKGDVITGSASILNEEVKFYSKLYASNIECIDENILDKIGITDKDIPKISRDELNMCEGIITIGKCINVIKAMPNGKSPGSDGLPYRIL